MRRLIIMLAASILLISGCGKPTNTKNQTVMQDSNPLSTAVNITEEIETTEDLQADTPAPPGNISEYHPIVIKSPGSDIGILLGGFNQKWLTEDEAAAYIQGKGEYKLLSLTDYLGVGIGDTVITDNTPIPYTIDIHSNLPDNNGFLAISCDWNPQPRKPVLQSNSSEEYNNIVSKILEENGLKDIPVNVVQNYKIDIEGDGQDEVLLCAQNIEPSGLGATFVKNTYSLLVLRKIVDARVENIFLKKSIYLEDGEWSDGCPSVNNIEAIADLDGDGELELIIQYLYYEGFGYELYDFVENEVDLVLGSTYGGK